MTAQEELQKQKRKKKAETGISSFVNTFEKLWNTEAAYGYKKKKLVENEADKLAERYKKEGKEDQIWNISTEIRHYFPDGNKYEDHKDYVSKILRDYKGGIYRRKYDRETIRDIDSRIHPLEDTNSTTKRFSEFLDEEESTDPYSLSPNGARDLMERHIKEYQRLRKHCKNNDIDIDSENDFDIDEIRQDNARTRRTIDRLVRDDIASTEPAPELTDEKQKQAAKMLLDALREYANNILNVADNMEANNYFGSTEILDECRLAIKADGELWEPLVDKKWVYNYKQYIKIMSDHKKQSKNYASNESAIMLSRILPKETLSRIAREKRLSEKEISNYTMSEEQIDAVYSKIHNDMASIIRNNKPVQAALYKNFEASEQGYRALRECVKKPKQRENAFGIGRR